MSTINYKKDYKELYLPKQVPTIVTIPPIPFFMLEGEGDPNGESFEQNTGALYSLSYAVKMSYKSTNVPEGYFDYTVFPLEGVWDLIDLSVPATVKSNLKYNLMIRQPEFLTEALFDRFKTEVKKKKPNNALEKVKFETCSDGLCCQMLHLGSFDDEPASFALMEAFCEREGYDRISKTHREIYLSDPRKVEASKLKTVLRFQIAAK